MRSLHKLLPALVLCFATPAFAGKKDKPHNSKPPPIDTRHMSPEHACYASCMIPIQECMRKCGKSSSCQMKCANDGKECTDGCGAPPPPPK